MEIDSALRLVEGDPDYRVLRRIPGARHWKLPPSNGDLRRAVFVDVETTGLSTDFDEVIELGLLPFDYNKESGTIVAVHEGQGLSALRQPSRPIPEESTLVHGISNEDVQGKSVDAGAVSDIVSNAHLIIAHNAAFDRPMVERLWPVFEQKHWACSLADIDWRREGVGSGRLDYLLMRLGWFYESHRALGDALAGTFLLTQQLPSSKATGMASLLERARRPLKAVRAEETAFEQRAALKQRGYRWDAGGSRRSKAWWILTDDAPSEIEWLNTEIYRTPRELPVVDVPATRRYSGRVWPD